MNKPRLPDWLLKLLDASAGHRFYPLVVALIPSKTQKASPKASLSA
jgi:hypothetical protein